MKSEVFALYSTPLHTWLTLGVAVAPLTLGAVFFGFLLTVQAHVVPLAIALLWLVVGGYTLYQPLKTHVTIVLSEGGSIVFRSRVSSVELEATWIASIRPSRSQPGVLVLKHTGGSLRLFSNIDGLHRFLSALKELHPAVELRGC